MTLKPDKALDDYIIAASRIGDKAALDQLVRRWQPRLIAHAYRMIGDSELAKDVTQDAWVDIIRSLKRLQETRAFPAWAFRIVSRRSADVIKKRQSVRSLKSALDGEPKDKNEAQRRTEAMADRSSLANALALLPNEQRVVMALFYLEEFTVSEVAHSLEIPVGTVKTRLMHGRKKMRSALETKGDQTNV